MPLMAGKQTFLELLKQEGVELLFGNPGTTELPLMDALAREPGLRYILALQEAVVIAMADGYAQASGRLAAVNVHISPGLGNAMGMLYNAWKAGSPLLVTVASAMVLEGLLMRGGGGPAAARAGSARGGPGGGGLLSFLCPQDPDADWPSAQIINGKVTRIGIFGRSYDVRTTILAAIKFVETLPTEGAGDRGSPGTSQPTSA